MGVSIRPLLIGLAILSPWAAGLHAQEAGVFASLDRADVDELGDPRGGGLFLAWFPLDRLGVRFEYTRTEAATPSLREISLLDPGLLVSYPALPPLRDESDSEAPLVGAVIGGAAGAVVSILLAERATGSSAVHPLFVLGGILIGCGIGTAF